MNLKTVAILAAFAANSAIADSGTSSSCMVKECKAGTAAITYAKKAEPYFACPSKELAEYTNFVLSIVAMQAMFGSMPNISPLTGEPEQQGKTKDILDMMRTKARVRTFDEAVGYCSKGRDKLKVTVANNTNDTTAIWVFDAKNNGFWMPKVALNPLK